MVSVFTGFVFSLFKHTFKFVFCRRKIWYLQTNKWTFTRQRFLVRQFRVSSLFLPGAKRRILQASRLTFPLLFNRNSHLKKLVGFSCLQQAGRVCKFGVLFRLRKSEQFVILLECSLPVFSKTVISVVFGFFKFGNFSHLPILCLQGKITNVSSWILKLLVFWNFSLFLVQVCASNQVIRLL